MLHFLLVYLIIIGTTITSLSLNFKHFYAKLWTFQVLTSARYNQLMGHMNNADSMLGFTDQSLDFTFMPSISIPNGLIVDSNRFVLGSKPHLNTAYAGSLFFRFHKQHYRLTFPVGLSVISLYLLH